MDMKTEGFAKTAPLSLLNDPTLLKTDALINGHWVKGASRFDVHDPATGKKLADVANLTAKDAEAAIDAANAAWPAWRHKTGKERSIILRKWFDLLMANQEDLGRIMTAEQGKPFAEAKGEVAYGASFVEWFAEEAKRVNGETLPQFDNNRRLMVLKQPIGVVAAVVPHLHGLGHEVRQFGFHAEHSPREQRAHSFLRHVACHKFLKFSELLETADAEPSRGSKMWGDWGSAEEREEQSDQEKCQARQHAAQRVAELVGRRVVTRGFPPAARGLAHALRRVDTGHAFHRMIPQA
mgnify:CR=1 FL=1